jgi:catechol 2,3-dioxygenase-like lactoylglutathione lyase family enzyme
MHPVYPVGKISMKINHINMRCSNLETTRQFLESVALLKVGDRPPITAAGYWLYDDSGTAVVHLIQASYALGAAGAVDHVAFFTTQLPTEVDRLTALGYLCKPYRVPGTEISQLFIDGPDNIQIELQGVL